MTEMNQTAKPPHKRTKKSAQAASIGEIKPPAHDSSPSGLESPALAGEFIGKDDQPDAQALVALNPMPNLDEDEAVVQRVEHLSKDVGWALVSAGVVGLVMPGVIGAPFLIMGALALWPGNHKRVERWRQGHSPKAFHGAMKQINRFLDDLEKRYPHIDKP